MEWHPHIRARAESAAVVVVMLAAAAQAARLRPADDQPQGLAGLRPAVLTVENDTGQVVRGLAINDEAGGPTFIFPAIIAPGVRQEVRVRLPAISQQQAYRVRLLAAGGDPASAVGAKHAELVWPAELVSVDAFLAPQAYGRWGDRYPAWSGRLRRQVFGVAALGAVAMVAGRLLSRPVWRVLWVLAAAAGVSAAIWLLLAPRAVVVQQPLGDGLVLVAARRTAEWVGSGDLLPQYLNLRQLRADQAAIEPGRSVRAAIDPQWPRIFRRLE